MGNSISFIQAYDDDSYFSVYFEDEINFQKIHKFSMIFETFASIGISLLCYFIYKKYRKAEFYKAIGYSFGAFLVAGFIIGNLSFVKRHYQLGAKLGEKYNLLYSNSFSGDFYKRIFS